MMKTTRWPRSRSTAPMPAQLLVGPCAPSGKKTIVAIGVRPRSDAIVMPMTIVAIAAAGSDATIAAHAAEHGVGAERHRDAGDDGGREHRPPLGHQPRPGEPRHEAVELHERRRAERDGPDDRGREQSDDADDRRDPTATMPPRIAFASRRASSRSRSSMWRGGVGENALAHPVAGSDARDRLGAVLLEHLALVPLDGVVVDEPDAEQEDVATIGPHL